MRVARRCPILPSATRDTTSSSDAAPRIPGVSRSGCPSRPHAYSPPGAASARSVSRSSLATLAASWRRSNPTSLPSDVVTGEFSRSCWTMNPAVSSTEANGRNVLGPGRMACSIRRSGSAASSVARRSPSTTRCELTATQASHPAARTRSRTSSSRSSSEQVGTSVRATDPARGRWALVPSEGNPAASQSSLPASYSYTRTNPKCSSRHAARELRSQAESQQ
jgi:hypothetical protein